MERYFILVIAVTLVAVPTQKKNRQRAWFANTQLATRNIAGLTTCDNGADYADILPPYSTFKATAGVFGDTGIPESCTMFCNPYLWVNLIS